MIAAAAGNSAGPAVSSPASCRGVIAVAGLRHVGTKVGFSSLGAEVAISAPGGNCVNPAPGSPCTDSFNASVGTSFSAPLVAGVAALLLSARPELTPQQVTLLLQQTARPFPPLGSIDSTTAPQCTPPQYSLQARPLDQQECHCTTTTCGAGMLDVGAGLAAAGR